MSRHVWQTKRFTPSVRADAAEALKVYVETLGHDDPRSMTQALTFVGYYLERVRQKGGVSAEFFLEVCRRSGHRYRTGRNRGNYLAAGTAAVSQAYRSFGLNDPGGALPPAEVVWDYYLEHRDDLPSLHRQSQTGGLTAEMCERAAAPEYDKE